MNRFWPVITMPLPIGVTIMPKDRGILDWAAAKNPPALKDIAAPKNPLKRAEFDWLFGIANLKMAPETCLLAART